MRNKLLDDITGYEFNYRPGIAHKHEPVGLCYKYDSTKPKMPQSQAKALFALHFQDTVQPIIQNLRGIV